MGRTLVPHHALFHTLSLFHYEQDELLSARNVVMSPLLWFTKRNGVLSIEKGEHRYGKHRDRE